MKVRKRNGKLVEFDENKIIEAIWKAAQDLGGKDREEAERLGKQVSAQVNKDFQDKLPTVEDVQDSVEKVLINSGHAKTAKHYILYRESRKNLRNTQQLFIDSHKLVNDYLMKEDWRVYENANAVYSFPGLLWHSAGTVMSYYTLNYMYPKEIANQHISGAFHIHDLRMGISGYCAGWSLRQVLHEGFNGVPGKVECKPPKHLRTAIGQMIDFMGTLQNEWAGAQAFSSFNTYLAPYVKADNLSYNEIKQCIQEFVYGMNVGSRWAGETPFTNVSLDLTIPKDLNDQKVSIGGKFIDSTFSDYQEELEKINKAFIEVLLNGDAKNRVFTFPIPTYNLTKDFNWNSDIANLLFDMTAKYGLPYFQNFINSDLNPEDVRAMCCRLQLDLSELRKNTTAGRFGSGESTGSVGVVTINLPRLACNSKDENEFFENLDQLMYLAKESLEIKRKTAENNIKRNLLPFTKRYLGNLDRHFSTIGLIGMNEACLNFLGKDIASDEGKEFALKVLNYMRSKLLEYQEETGHIYNLEATPAEGAAYRLAQKDKKQFPNIITSGGKEPYYTNSTMLPVDYSDDLFFSIKHQEPLQKLYTGGTVFHTFLGEAIDSKACKLIVKKIATNFTLPYFTMTPTFSICESHGYLKDQQELCPKCNHPTEVYSRIVGYFRPVKDWNAGKQQEFKDRKVYKIESC
ncbi:MAG: ribonucleoside triphosphate reductase [archaeon]